MIGGVGEKREASLFLYLFHCIAIIYWHILEFFEDLDHQIDMLLPFTILSFAQMIETDEDFSPFPGGYDYLVDFLDLSFPKERPSREHPYEEVSSNTSGNAPSVLLFFLNK